MRSCKIKFFVLSLYFVSSAIAFDYNRFFTDDAIILEAPRVSRRTRDIRFNDLDSSQISDEVREGKQLETILTQTGPCYTSKGTLGKCKPFKECYPFFKLPDLSNLETWIFGMYDTCAYYDGKGQQSYGVCCVNQVQSTTNPTVENETTDSVVIKAPGQVVLSNWPPTHPPLPTHGPNNTIPPLPTHPTPSSTTVQPGWTTKTTKPQWTQTQWTQWTKPVTSKPITTSKPVTTSKPIQPVDVTQCGAKNFQPDQERIVGGQNAGLGEWPWIAALFNGGRQFCGGSLIDNIHILSAAHCVAHMSSWDVARLTVRLGDYNIKTNTEVQHIEKRVKRVVRHRGFDSRTLYNDVAILTLDSPVTFNNQIRPICLPTGGTFAGKMATVIGWGSLRESGPQPAILQEVSIPIWPNSECRNKYGAAAPGGIVEHMLCAGEASRDSCSGDSGGPLMVTDGKWTQVGIVSWGIGCGKGQYPGVYTRVTHFLPWIQKNLK